MHSDNIHGWYDEVPFPNEKTTANNVVNYTYPLVLCDILGLKNVSHHYEMQCEWAFSDCFHKRKMAPGILG